MQGWSTSHSDHTTNIIIPNYDRTLYWKSEMAGPHHELRRSYTQVEFALPRDRPFNVRAPNNIIYRHNMPPSMVQVPDKRRFSAMPRVRHATMEIYRPPSVRMDGGSTSPPGRLNVHAKEFTMNRADLATSRSSGNLAVMNGYQAINGRGIQHSKSSGNVLHAINQSKSSANITQTAQTKSNLQNRVHFRVDSDKSGLKRSKSLSASDTKQAIESTKTFNAPVLPVGDLGSFPKEMQDTIQKALTDPNDLSARTIMQLVKVIVEKAVENLRYADSAAKLCINIIEKEKKETFLESLLNMCQLWYQERDKFLISRYPTFMAFLNEMYCQLKRSQLQLKTHYDGVPPPLLLLMLLSKCCQDCLKPPAIQSPSDTECLFFVLSSIGRDLETELPKELEQVLTGVRDAFLTAVTTPAIRKTLLQLIELSSAKWQLPASAVMYYYPGTMR
ncbi:CBP80/20-dependent translation initiation factor isoform X5 [Nilaparvata lugens]|uniref:CBP80/20-dependent translation initiation factor isoform X4 n=3 Tax=Nilaparvata lugens TaxID=108931 RepID=UPI00193D6195|nr:CBP80/20-dependent translation initiation factor isoform X4 [Nilaparvata lugens]XP_039292477.1 CBP80/20-dependent translation initiation factor isoform X5 [Nilaparvata lugens]